MWNYLMDGWNQVDVVIYALFTAAFFFRVITLFDYDDGPFGQVRIDGESVVMHAAVARLADRSAV